MGCGREERFVERFGRMNFKGSFLVQDTRSHQDDDAEVFRLLSIFGFPVTSTTVLRGMFLRGDSMQPMV